MIDATLRTAGGDGASATVPRRRFRLHICRSNHRRMPDGSLAEVLVYIATHRRWRSACASGRFDPREYWTIDAGPFLVCIKLTV